LLPERSELPLTKLDSARELSRRHPVWLCDVWGVVHNGAAAIPEACDALIRHRQNGGVVVLLTNAPRRWPRVVAYFDRLGVPPGIYDRVVSSGDVTRDLIEMRAGQNIFHLGPDRDHDLTVDLPVTFTDFEAADAVLCTGLFDDHRESVADYAPLLAAMRRRDMTMICANPDKVVHVGERLFPCAGLLAEQYTTLGGRVEMAGKPFAPIYRSALAAARDVLARQVANEEILAIGDSLATDIAGAAANHFPALFISQGIHREEIVGVDEEGLASLIAAAAPGITILGYMDRLRWARP
jgi:HAD superfamily hydrolase (TIGR01459 family)